MQAFDMHDAACELAKHAKKPVIFIRISHAEEWEFLEYNNYDYPFDGNNALKAAPYLNAQEHTQIMADQYAFILCEDEDEQDRLFWLTVGDDGPTNTNPYNGASRVYAMTISADGEPLSENT